MTSIVRTLIVCLVFGGVILLGYHQIRRDVDRQAIAELEALNHAMQERLAEREAMIERLSRSRRLAHVQVVGQRFDDQGNAAESNILFIEVDDDGTELARQSFTIPGDVLFVDAWTVKFNANDVAAGHPVHGRTLVLLRRIYSDRMPPREGFPIDTPGAIPPGYAAGEIGRFEQRLWNQFWRIATDAPLARAMNVRVAQGEAVYKPVREGQMFSLTADASGGISLVPIDPADKEPRALTRGDG